MPEGGDLHVTVESARPGQPAEEAGPPTHAVLTVRDTGAGITPEVKERLFEPFFTTKSRAARGSRGMGLAVVYAAVKNAGGYIEVEGQPGSGTTFRVCLPLAEGVPETAAPPVALAGPQRGTGTILLVDDDAMVSQVCVDALTSWGYAVITAASPTEARERVASNAQETIALAIIDTNVAGGSGVGLAQQLAALDPHLRMILTTCFADEQVPEQLAPSVCTRLTKPFRMEALADAVAAAIASGGRVG
jgi:CheY-like chemotaxis protein